MLKQVQHDTVTMKDLKQLLRKKTVGARSALDEKSVLVVFAQIIREEYGKQGAQNIKPAHLKDKKMFVEIVDSHWAGVLWPNKTYLLGRINEQLGGEEIADLAPVRQ